MEPSDIVRNLRDKSRLKQNEGRLKQKIESALYSNSNNNQLDSHLKEANNVVHKPTEELIPNQYSKTNTNNTTLSQKNVIHGQHFFSFYIFLFETCQSISTTIFSIYLPTPLTFFSLCIFQKMNRKFFNKCMAHISQIKFNDF